jgi:hypothetical protein
MIGQIPAISTFNEESDRSGDLDNEAIEEGPAIPPLPGDRTLIMSVNGPNYELLRFESKFLENETFLLKPSRDWLSRPGDWLSAINREDREEFNEFLTFIDGGGRGSVFIRMIDHEDDTHYIEVKGVLDRPVDALGPSQLRLELNVIEEALWQTHAGQHAQADPGHFRFDAIFIEAGMIRIDLQPWLEGVIGLLIKAGIMRSDEQPPKIFVMASEKSQKRPDDFRVKGITDFFYKPLDRKLIVDHLFTLLPNMERIDDVEFSGFVPCETPAKLAKNVIMDELSEYGLSIVNSSALKPGSFMRFFSQLFGEDSSGILGRCTHFEKIEGEKASGVRCYFTFFGCPDEILKRIRNWIREDYVHKKEGAN